MATFESPARTPESGPLRVEIRADVWLDGRLALWLAKPRLLVLADLHWGYAASHREEGNLLPVWGDGDIAERLRGLIVDYRPDGMVWVGDSLHAPAGRGPAERFLAESGVPPTVVLSGNHDFRWKRVEDATLCRDGYFLHHGHSAPEVPSRCVEIVGHFHPAVSWSDGAGGRLKLPALVDSPNRIVLPAFSPWSAGTPWMCRSGERLWAIGGRRIFRMPPRS